MKVVIDRFEGNYAVCEKPDRTMLNLEKSTAHKASKQGDGITIDLEETAKRKMRLKN